MPTYEPDLENLQRTADHWDTWQRDLLVTPGRYNEWGDHPTVFQAVMRHVFGKADVDFFSFLKERYPGCSQGHALSLCCGDGAFEEQLLQSGVFGQITGLELSPQRIADGKARISECKNGEAKRLHFMQQDVNLGGYGEQCFDVVFAKAALHHIEQLEQAMDGIRRCLRPGGLLITIDFFGPSRFQWTEAQLDACNWFWTHRVPPNLQRGRDGRAVGAITRPTLDTMIAMDPSEAVRSGELHSMLRDQFDVLEDFALGGTVVHLLLSEGRVNHFDASNPLHNAVLEEAVTFERQLISSGALTSDFRFVVARPRAREQST
jgi:SAM-dependent methyltransferase